MKHIAPAIPGNERKKLYCSICHKFRANYDISVSNDNEFSAKCKKCGTILKLIFESSVYIDFSKKEEKIIIKKDYEKIIKENIEPLSEKFKVIVLDTRKIKIIMGDIVSSDTYNEIRVIIMNNGYIPNRYLCENNQFAIIAHKVVNTF